MYLKKVKSKFPFFMMGFFLLLTSTLFQNCLKDARLELGQPSMLNDKELQLDSSWIDTSALIAYWKLNETQVVDGSTIQNSQSASLAGVLSISDVSDKVTNSKLGTVLFFDGTDDHILIDESTDKRLNFGTQTFTYMVWVNVPSSSGKWDMPISKGGYDAATAGYDLELGLNQWAAYASDGSNIFNVVLGDESEFLNHWVHLAVVVDREKQQMRGYVNGVLRSLTNIATLGNINSTQTLNLAGNPGASPFKGLMADVAFWNRVVTEKELMEIYKRVSRRF